VSGFTASALDVVGAGADPDRCIGAPSSRSGTDGIVPRDSSGSFVGKVDGTEPLFTGAGGDANLLPLAPDEEPRATSEEVDIFLVRPLSGLLPRPITSPGLCRTRGTTIDRPTDGCIRTGGVVLADSRRGVLCSLSPVRCAESVKFGSEMEGVGSTATAFDGDDRSVGLTEAEADTVDVLDKLDADRSRLPVAPVLDETFAAALAASLSLSCRLRPGLWPSELLAVCE
jgi:hypothetical protein